MAPARGPAVTLPSASASPVALLVSLVLQLAVLAPGCAAQTAPLLPNAISPTATACNSGQTMRPCTIIEQASGWGNRTSCPCPYLDGGGGGPGPVKYFSLTISHLILPSRIANFSKTHVVANGQIPGPTIDVNEGDWVEVSVTNAMDGVPTTIHWHGFLNVMTPYNDGVPAITQCALQPGATMIYSFRASNAGTYWYHGHMLEQYTEGLFGPLIVRAPPGTPQVLPAVDNEVILMLQDYYNNDAHSLLTLFYLTPPAVGIEPIPDAVAVNGAFSQQLFIPVPSRTGKTLFRIIGSQGFSMYSFSIDGVNLQVVEVDSTAVAPFTRPYVVVNTAQRYSVVVDWSTLPASFNATPSVYFRLVANTNMYAVNISGYIPPYEEPLRAAEQFDPNYFGVIQFSPLSAGNLVPIYAVPDTTDDDVVFSGYFAAPITTQTFAGTVYAGITNITQLAEADSNMIDARPLLPVPMPSLTHQLFLTLKFADDSYGINRGRLNDITHVHNMEGGLMPEVYVRSVYGTALGGAIVDDTSLFVYQAAVPASFGNMFGPLPTLAVPYTAESHYHLPAGGVICLIVYSYDGGDHPWHMHGHTFWLISTSERPDAEKLYAGNYARRDTVTIPGNGWIKIGFIADNPGVWAAHCHIEWHVATGLMIELFEGLAALAGLPIPLSHQQNCNLPPPGAASFIVPNPFVDQTAAIIVGGEAPFAGAQPVVQTANCSTGQPLRQCSLIERATTGWSNASTCKCPYVDGVSGGAGPVKSFVWSVTHNVVASPLDPAVNKVLFAINGEVPGPTLVLNEGDWLQVTVTNNMDEEDMMFNWHGFSQTLTPFNDGVDTVTQCSLQPGNTMAYGIRMERAGSYFYRGSINQQDIDGLSGAIIVRAPAGTPEALPAFDSEAVLLVDDYYLISSHTLLSTYYLTALSGGVEPVPDAITVNGGFTPETLPPGFSRSSLTWVPLISSVPGANGAVVRAKKTFFHLVAATALTSFGFCIDGVNLRVVEIDTTPVVPFTVPVLVLSPGQRVAFIVDWTTVPANFVGSNVFFHVQALPSSYAQSGTSSVPFYEAAYTDARPLVPNFCGTLVFGALAADGTGQLPTYYNTTTATGLSVVVPPPASSNAGTAYSARNSSLGGLNLIDARPAVPVAMPNAGTHTLYARVAFANDALGVNRPSLNNISHTIDPTGGVIPGLYTHMIYGTVEGGAVQIDPAAFPLQAAPASGASFGAALPSAAIMYSAEGHYLVPSGAVVVLVLDNAATTRTLPFHVHGGVFWIIATSDRPDAEAAYAGNYLRRDVVVVPPRGWAKVAFVADNPGMWVVESAVIWHVTAGLSLELLAAMPALSGLSVPVSHRAACGLAVPSATPSPPPFAAITVAPAVSASPSAAPGTAVLSFIVAVQGVPTWTFGDLRVIGLFDASLQAVLFARTSYIQLSVRIKLVKDIVSGTVIYTETRRRTHGRGIVASSVNITAGVQINFDVFVAAGLSEAPVTAAVASAAFGPAVLQEAAACSFGYAPELVLEPFYLSPSASLVQYAPPVVVPPPAQAVTIASTLSALTIPLTAGLGGAALLCLVAAARYRQLRLTVWRKGIVVPRRDSWFGSRRASQPAHPVVKPHLAAKAPSLRRLTIRRDMSKSDPVDAPSAPNIAYSPTPKVVVPVKAGVQMPSLRQLPVLFARRESQPAGPGADRRESFFGGPASHRPSDAYAISPRKL